jgi:hypothetical protein
MGKLFSPGPWLVLPVLAIIGVSIGTFILRQLVVIEV